MAELLGVARFTFFEGKAEDFKRLSAQCMEVVRTKDTGTLQYEIFLDEEEASAVVIERYRDSEALLEHFANIGEELMAAMQEVGTLEGETLGDPSPELRAMLNGPQPRLLSPFLSL
ncbi:hypothetical protein DSM112329_01106 [Paraconexibacter sp. AEG42_29]|uniref:ABM domain-containing protein n=1 Tax=Paraconexibacter sp. AEG42_29 TaxID=2997339 RepID=A0AAU7ARQ3_9ACTN